MNVSLIFLVELKETLTFYTICAGIAYILQNFVLHS